MPNNYQPQSGDILLFKPKKGFDPIGSFITAEERDTDVSHAAFIGFHENLVWTTGAETKFGLQFFYGADLVERYIKNRGFYVCRYDGITMNQKMLLFDRAWEFRGQIYGFHKVALLMLKAGRGGIVKRLYPWATRNIKHPFCSEAVVECYNYAGIDLFTALGKEEPSAMSPANIKQYAQMKDTKLNIVGEF